MAVTTHFYPKGLKRAFAGDIDWDAHAIKAALMGSGHSYNTAHETWSDVSANEVTGTNYTGGGQALTSKTNTVAGAVHTLDSDDPVWASSTITGAWHLVLYDSTTGYLILCVSFGQAYNSNNSNFTYSLPGTGWGDGTAA